MKIAMKNPKTAGFTLVEMMMVMTMIAILATIALPKLAYALQKAKEGSAKGNLGSLRTALSVYYADTEGRFPSDLSELTVGGKYLSAIPAAKGLSQHPDSAAVALGTFPTDAGGWSYNNVASDAKHGTVVINCAHPDLLGRLWSDQ